MFVWPGTFKESQIMQDNNISNNSDQKIITSSLPFSPPHGRDDKNFSSIENPKDLSKIIRRPDGRQLLKRMKRNSGKNMNKSTILIDGGIATSTDIDTKDENGTSVTQNAFNLLDSYMIPETVHLFQLGELNPDGGTLYVMDVQRRFYLAVKDETSPSVNFLILALKQNHPQFTVTVAKFDFNAALDIAKATQNCLGLQFMDNLNKPDFFYVKAPQEWGGDTH